MKELRNPLQQAKGEELGIVSTRLMTLGEGDFELQILGKSVK